MKNILTAAAVALALITQTASAQTDAKAKGILEATSKKVNSLKSLKAGFALKLAGGNGKVKESRKGTFSMKGQKYHVSLPGQEIICDGKTVWTYMKDGNEVQVSNYNPSEQTVSPTKLFTNFYDKEYKYRYVGSRTVSGKACDVVEMVPVNKAKQFSKVELAVDKSSNIVGGNVWEKNGNQYQYEVSNYVPNAAVTDAEFTFNAKAHPGVEVVDLR